MALHIDDDHMTLELDGAKTHAAVRVGSLWRVTGWPRPLNGNKAITALTLTEWLLTGHSADAPCAGAWREELDGA